MVKTGCLRPFCVFVKAFRWLGLGFGCFCFLGRFVFTHPETPAARLSFPVEDLIPFGFLQDLAGRSLPPAHGEPQRESTGI